MSLVKKLGACICMLSLSWIASPVQAAIAWNVTFMDVTNSTGVGFDDPTFGAARRGTFQSALNYINTVVSDNGVADLVVLDSQTDASGFLAAAGPYVSGTPNGFQNGFVFDHVKNGVDPSGLVPDATVTFDFGYSWNSETDDPTGSEFDLFSVALHEVTHTMGFLSLVDENGQSEVTGSDPGVFSVYDSFLERGDGTKLFGPGGDFLGTAADLTSGDVFFGGPNATAGNGGAAVPVYAPNPFKPGSSISHVQLGANEVMQYSIGKGVKRRSYLPAEAGILQDIGWAMGNSTAVPEPASWIVWAFFGIATLLVQRRRNR